MNSLSTGENLVSANATDDSCIVVVDQARDEPGVLHKRRKEVHEIPGDRNVTKPEKELPLNHLPLLALPSSNISPGIEFHNCY